MKEASFYAEKADIGLRLDIAISKNLQISRSHAQTLIENGGVRVDGCPCVKSHLLKGGETVTALVPAPKSLAAAPENIPVDILYEDDFLLVVNKPKGMVTHPAPGNESGTLANALLYHCRGGLSTLNGPCRPGIVHRLDKDTSGLLIAAKTDEAHKGLALQIARHSFTRKYEAVCTGKLKNDAGTLDFPLGRNPKDRKKMAVNAKKTRTAVTRFRVIGRYRGYTHLELTLETGRTHQIRVHLSHLGYPIAGDGVYGKAKNPFGLQGQCLFARSISFTHPITGEALSFEAPYPPYFTKTLELLNKTFYPV